MTFHFDSMSTVIQKWRVLAAFAIFSVINLLLLGCAETKVDSFLDPLYQEGYNFEKTVVWAPGLQLGTQQILESKLVELLATNGVIAVRGFDLFPPTQDFTNDEIKNVLDQYEVNTALFLTDYYRSWDPVWGEPEYSYTWHLYDHVNDKQVWIADFKLVGSTYIGPDGLSRGVAKGAINELISKGLLK